MGLCGSCMRIPTGNQKKQRCRSEMCSSHAGALRPACASLARMLSTPAEEMISLREAIEDVINDGGPPLAGPYGTGRAEVGSNRSCTKRSHSKKRNSCRNRRNLTAHLIPAGSFSIAAWKGQQMLWMV